jgi:hypothetical protein
MRKIYFYPFSTILSIVASTNAQAVMEKNMLQAKTNSPAVVTAVAVSKALTEIQLRRLKSVLQNQNAYGTNVDQVLDRIEALQNQLRGER